MESSLDKPVLIYTIHKAASMFLHLLTQEIADELHLNYYSINSNSSDDASFYTEIIESSWNNFIGKKLSQSEQRACFGPIRAGEARPSIPENISDYSVVLHLRDPRDVLTSLFFSHAYSHEVHPEIFNPGEDVRKQWAETGIDNYVWSQANNFLSHYDYVLDGLLGRDSVILLRYEDMVADYHTWLHQFLQAFMPVDSPEENRGAENILKKLLQRPFSHQPSFTSLFDRLYQAHRGDFQVDQEDIYSHRRQVTPGDHQRKLQPETIARLDEKFTHVLKALGYAYGGVTS